MFKKLSKPDNHKPSSNADSSALTISNGSFSGNSAASAAEKELAEDIVCSEITAGFKIWISLEKTNSIQKGVRGKIIRLLYL